MSTETAITINPKEFGLEETKAEQITSGLLPTLAERNILAEAYKLVIEKDINDPATTKEARELRLKIKDNRTKGVEAWHKVNKEFYLRGGQFVDAIKKKEVLENERMEDNLLQIEKHSENMEAERIAKLQTSRENELLPYGVENAKTMILGGMAEDMWSAFLTGIKKTYEDKIEALRLAEEQRVAKYNALALHNSRKEQLLPYWNFVPADKRDTDFSTFTEKEWTERYEWSVKQKENYDAEQLRIQAENDRLKLEADAKEKQIAHDKAERERIDAKNKERQINLIKLGLSFNGEEFCYKDVNFHWTEIITMTDEQFNKAYSGATKRMFEIKEAEKLEREEAEAKIENERKDKARIEKELADKKAEQERIEADKKKAEKKAQRAPDKTKLMGLAAHIKAIPMPEVKSEEAQMILDGVKVMLGKLTGYIAEKVEAI